MGDGLLCYFGYSPWGASKPSNHADIAIQCALDIQRQNVELGIAESATDKAFFPLRIGINSAGVFFGDMGDERRIDFTVIGHGVNFAQRLEAACEPHRIMVSSSTWSIVTTRSANDPEVSKRSLQIKNHKTAFTAYEIEPFFGKGETIAQAIKIYNKKMSLERGENRVSLPPNLSVSIHTAEGEGRLENYSSSGIAVLLPNYLAKSFVVGMTIELPPPFKNAQKQKFMLFGEVRWGRVTPEGYLHGIMFKNLAEEERSRLFHSLNQACLKAAV